MTGPDQDPTGATPAPSDAGDGLRAVLGVGTNTLRKALTRLPERQVDFEALDAAFDIARSTLGAEDSDVASDDGGSVAREREGGDGIASQELEQLVKALEARHASASLQLGEVDREEASILVQIVVASDDAASQARAVVRLEELRRRELDAAAAGLDKRPEHQISGIVAEAIVDLAEALTIEKFDRMYLMLAPTFRRIVHPVLEHLPHLADGMTEHGLEALWPHAVDEMLILLRRRRTGLDPRLHVPSPAARTRALSRLVRLPAIAEERLDPMALEMDQHFVHDLMLELLQMPPARAVVGRALLSALRRTPPHEPWLANVLRPIEAYSPKIEPFLHAAVASLSDANSQGVLIETAADILLDSLRRLDDERRGAPWVPGALEWIGAHGSLSALDFLEHVQKERKFLRPTWSKECRRAASAGIQRGWGEA